MPKRSLKSIFGSFRSKNHKKMDSPSDLSPNAPHPPSNFDDLIHTGAQPVPERHEPASAEGSIDSSGFEKVDHDVLEEYSTNFANQMQQSVFGQLQSDVGADDETYNERAAMGDQQHTNETTDLLGSPLRNESPVIDPHPVHQENYHSSDLRDLIDDVVNDAQSSPRDYSHPEEAISFSPARHESPAPPSPPAYQLEQSEPELHSETEVHHQPEADVLHESPLPVHESDIIPSEPEHDNITEQVDNFHKIVDDILDSAQEDQFDELVAPSRTHHDVPQPDVDDELPQFGSQTPEEETYQREGPLTIPSIAEKFEKTEEEEFDVHPNLHQRGFETAPRPPTPPKEISEEDVKPSVVQLDPSSHSAHHSSDTLHSILRHSSHEPWIRSLTRDPRSKFPVLELIYWRDAKKSAISLSLILLAVFILAKYPLLSVIAYSGLAVLGATLAFRIFKAVEGQIKKTGGENPFQDFLTEDISLPQEKVHSQVDVIVEHVTLMANKLKKIVFVESIVESVKFVIALWSLTYISSWFSGFALVILSVVGVYSIPKLYETYQEPIDAQLDVITGHINNVSQLLEDKLPFLKKPVAEKKDE